jgi:hypothetical protein
MILRRIIEHVKAQNWTAVALYFVIVVTGVSIGIQATMRWQILAEPAEGGYFCVFGQLKDIPNSMYHVLIGTSRAAAGGLLARREPDA